MIAEKLRQVEIEIEQARLRRTRVPKDDPVRLVAVTKNHDITAMREAVDAGISEIGENRIQEAKDKFDRLHRSVIWHLIGHLQTNKAKQAVKYFQLIHSVDSSHLALALDKAAASAQKVQDILVQINLAGEASKSGVRKDGLMDLLKEVDSMEHLRLRGLMLIAPYYEDAEMCRPLFREMYEIFRKIQGIEWSRAKVEYLSMGMTHDYRIAVEEGANIVRVGTAIFGQRQYEGVENDGDH